MFGDSVFIMAEKQKKNNIRIILQLCKNRDCDDVRMLFLRMFATREKDQYFNNIS